VAEVRKNSWINDVGRWGGEDMTAKRALLSEAMTKKTSSVFKK